MADTKIPISSIEKGDEMKKVSVIIAAYNIENYIEKCLHSIIQQSLKDIEIIVVNDGSIDNTLKKIERLAKKDARINVIDKKNEGLIEARKTGLKQAKGEYILFVDGDDWLELDALEKLYTNALECHSDIVVYNCFKSRDEDKEVYNIFEENIVNSGDLLKEVLLVNILPSIWSKFIKHEFIKENNIVFPSKISYAEDLATIVTMFMYNPRVSFEKKALYNYYQRPESITKTMNNKIFEIDLAFNHIEEQLREKNFYQKYKEEFEFLVYQQIIQNHLLRQYYKSDTLGEKLYKLYFSKNIEITNNRYFIELYKKSSNTNKLKTKIYHYNYKLGRNVNLFNDSVKRMLRRS